MVFLSVLIYGIKSEKKNFHLKIFHVPPHMVFKKIFKPCGGVHEKIFSEKIFFSYFIPYIKTDKKMVVEYHIRKSLTHSSKSQYWFTIVTLNLHKVLQF